MTLRLITAASVLALVSACSSQPGPSSVSLTEQADRALRAGNFAVAEQAYQGILARDANNATAMLGLAEVYQATGRTTQAVDLYQTVSSARSGAIRVWSDGNPRQDGVTEVAMRQLGVLGHGMGASTAAHTSVVQTHVWPENPVYALDTDGTVYYADPAATQPISMPVYETREAAEMMAPVVTHSAIETYEPVAPIVEEAFLAPTPIAPAPIAMAPAYTAPTYAAPAPIPAPAVHVELPAPAPAMQTVAQPYGSGYGLDSDGVVYYADPDATQPITGPLYETPEAAHQAIPASLRQAAPMPAPVVTAPIEFEAAPTFTAPALPTPTLTPLPARAPVAATSVGSTAAASRSQPGYAVVDGNFVYISAEDIAQAGGGAATTSAPVATQQIFTTPSLPSAPVNPPLIEMNGIPSLNLN